MPHRCLLYPVAQVGTIGKTAQLRQETQSMPLQRNSILRGRLVYNFAQLRPGRHLFIMRDDERCYTADGWAVLSQDDSAAGDVWACVGSGRNLKAARAVFAELMRHHAAHVLS